MRRTQSHAARKHAEKLKLAEKKVAAGLVSERFPSVSKIVINMTYNSESNVMLRTINFYRSSHAYFHMRCMRKDCPDGGFNLAPKIGGMIRRRDKNIKGTMVCKGEGCSSSNERVSISYTINVKYK